ncbi:MAG: DUF2290 domain-containing protein [Planctomycetaceae bacterium]|nr:DUF2290 domain-containing protein [Planctomycetaceae bacterium]
MKATANDVRQEVDGCLELLIEAGVALRVNPVVIDRNGRKARVTWRPLGGSGLLEATHPFASVAEYCAHVRNEAYSAFLYDGSLLQITYEFYSDRLTGHRLCLYPCPYDVDREELETQPFLDVIDLYRAAQDEYLRLRSPIRFDYDPRNASLGHPAVHAHILWGHCRCAVSAPLSFGHFLQFVFCNFFPEIWSAHTFLREWKRTFREQTITDDETSFIHLSTKSKDSLKLLTKRA